VRDGERPVVWDIGTPSQYTTSNLGRRDIAMQKYNIAQIGRIVGLTIIVIGVVLSAWNAIDLGEFSDGDDKFRYFLTSVLSFVASGGLVYIAAEILDRVTAKPT
jgi:hypothetical protein